MLNTLARSLLGSAVERPLRLRAVDLGSLIYGRMQPEEQSFFDEQNGHHHRIELRDLPHYSFWRDSESQTPCGGTYETFLSCAPQTRSSAGERISDYLRLYQDIQADGVKEPANVLVAPDGRKIILDGHRRAGIAYALGIDLPCVCLPLEGALRRIVDNKDEFYGTKNADRPYQSIFYKETELVKGRRRDVLERFRKVNVLEDIRGKDVLDLGSNIAVNAMTAWHFGARSVTAMEFSRRIAAAALQLSAVLDARINLMVQDLGCAVDVDRQFDTVFCFSLYAHVSDKTVLEQNIARLTRRTLYFEGHENGTADEYAHIFKHFRKVEQLGFNRDGGHSTASTRPFFRCIR